MKAIGIPVAEIQRAVDAYRRDRRLEMLPPLRKRVAARALARLKKACDEVVRALDDLPDELQTFYSGPLRASAVEIQHEAGWRLHNLLENRGKIRTGRRPMARVRLEARIGQLYEEHGGRMTTYDPRQYVEPLGGRRRLRGGHLARLLLKVYEMADIKPPSDLTPVLKRLRRASQKWAEHRARAAKEYAAALRALGTPADPRAALGR